MSSASASQYAIWQDFHNAPGLQTVLLEHAACMGARHGASHGLVRADDSQDPWSSKLRPAASTSAAATTAPVTVGSSAQLAPATAYGPPAPATLGAGFDVAPWPNPLTVAAFPVDIGFFILLPLPIHVGFWCGVGDEFPSILDVRTVY